MLPTHHRKSSEKLPSSQTYLAFIAKKYAAFAIAAVCGVYLMISLVSGPTEYAGSQSSTPHTHHSSQSFLPTPLPPLYEQWHTDLLRLPQHHWQSTKPGPDEKFFFVAGHARGTGWGNAMEEVLLNAYLAYKAGRSFVFANYTWNADGSQYSDYNGKKIPSQIPYSVMIRGPIVGGSWPPGDRAPLSVSRDYFEQVCPKKLTIIREEVHDKLASSNDAKQITDGWVKRLAEEKEPCVQSALESGQLYNYMVFGDRMAMRDIWHEFSTSPILTYFGWSPLVELAFDTNRELFLPSTSTEPYLSQQPFTTNAKRYTMIDGLLALHIRRGDFQDHCDHLANWSSDYVAFCSFPELPDAFTPPPHEDWGTNTPENKAIYRGHCFPTVDEIVSKVRAIRRTPAGRGLKKVYVMTNGSPEFIAELKEALQADYEWQMIASSRDLVLNREQKYVAQAVDMLVGQRAQVLVGNGFSTLTSNIVMMRMANHFPPESTRFW